MPKNPLIKPQKGINLDTESVIDSLEAGNVMSEGNETG